MLYVTLKDYNNLDEIHKLWNKEYGFIYPISKELFQRNLMNVSYESSFVCLNDDNNLVGFILLKFWQDEFKIGDYDESSWISLFYVDPKLRRLGIGSKLLELAEKEAKQKNKKTLYLGKDYLNYFPGLPVDLKQSCPWFEKRGFVRPYDTYDLIKKVNKSEKLRLKNNDFIFRTSTLNDKENLIQFMKNNWPGRWLKELLDYYANGGTGKEYVVGIDGDKICAFAKVGLPDTKSLLISYSSTWKNRFDALGGIGPLGVDVSYRKRQLGYDVVAYAHNHLIDNNASDIIIDWTGLLEFYRKMGFEVFKSYFYMSKTL